MDEVDDQLTVTDVKVQDIRWPTSLGAHGSDAMHTDPDYSCVYVTVLTTDPLSYGNGITFTLGRGTEVVVEAVKAMLFMVKDRNLRKIYGNFGSYWRELTSESQLRWIGPEKGVTHLAVAAIINSLWDLWAKLRGVPVWRLLVDMEPELLVSTIDFRYISDLISADEAVELLRRKRDTQHERVADLMQKGYLAYTTQVGWLGYPDEKLRKLCRKYLKKGFTAFKIKIGRDINDDLRRCKILREEIGYDKVLMIDANQVWNVEEAVEWVGKLSQFKPLWIEEPTSPDDVLGHARIAKELRPLNIGVATGEMCCNRVMFKQFLQAGAMQFCQIDSARIGGINEILSVYLMAAKLSVKICPHAGGVGLCEMVQHLQMWDYVSLSGTKTGRYIEYVDQQHEQFINPTVVQNAHYMPPMNSGYSTELKETAILNYEFPNGAEWIRLKAEGKV